jgi:hypothetical protein
MTKSARRLPRRRESDRWNLLTRQYHDRGLVLVVGAGISTASRLPGWKEMLVRVGENCWGRGGREKVEKLLQAGMSLPAIAGVLQSECGNSPVLFQRQLKKALYRDFPFREQALQPKKRAGQMRDLVDFVDGRSPGAARNSTLAAVAALCVRRSEDGNFLPNPRVHAVVTSNVDVLLRTYMRARYGEWLLGTVESPRRTRRAGKVPTYYMHGFLRYYARVREPGDEPSPCVFTEEEYFDFFNRPYSVFNYTMLYLLREYNCLFVGMSMQDLNIRRLLHYSTAELRGPAQARPTRTGLRHFAMLKRPDDPELERLTDISLRRIGARALWIDDFEEIPEHLGLLYGSDWESVYSLTNEHARADQGSPQRSSAARRASSSNGAK